MDGIMDALNIALGLGLESRDLNVLQIGLRAAMVFIVTILMVGLAKKRFMGRATAFDVSLGIMIGSIVSRAVTGNSPFLPALAATAVLLGMHWLFSGIALRWHGFGSLIKDEPRTLIRDGQVDEQAMRKSHMTEHDLGRTCAGRVCRPQAGGRSPPGAERQPERHQSQTRPEGGRGAGPGRCADGSDRDRRAEELTSFI
jgi:hypothetical protein